MKQIFELPVLVIILSLASLAIAQAQYSSASKVGGHSVAGLDQLRTMTEKGDSDAQHELAERYWIGFPVEQDMAAAMVWYRKDASFNGGRSDGASGGGNSRSNSGRSGNGGGNSGDGNTGGGNTGGGNTGDGNTGDGNTGGGNTGGRDQGDSGQGNSGRDR